MSSKNSGAIIPAAKQQLTVGETPYYHPENDEVLIEVRSAALNPLDWKVQDYDFFVTSYPAVLGWDVSGVVVEVANKDSSLKVGDRVATFLPNQFVSANFGRYGGFQKYVLSKERQITKIPDSIDFDGASTLGVATATVAAAIKQLNLARPPVEGKAEARKEKILVWGAASSVGSFGVQFLKNAGYQVVATASPKNHQLIKSYGVDHVVDYNDKDVVKKLQELGPYAAAFDTISLEVTVSKIGEVLKSNGGSVQVAVTLQDAEKISVPENVKLSFIISTSVFNGDGELGTWLFNKYLPVALKNGTIKVNETKVFAGGLSAVQDAFNHLKSGAVSGVKLVVHPHEGK